MRASAPAIRRSAFQRSFAPALAARFASTDAAASAKDGKIYQVIGAVVDGAVHSSHGGPQSEDVR
jgi:hypothetical protein